ncbi:MAG TPA: hypothetical protein VE972_08785 [Conexibacter sp.]|nr:hypothetical protein [Conexibacter sp.]
MQIRVEEQQALVADEVAALFAVVRPILEGLLYGLKANIVAEAGGREGVKLEVLTRLYEPGDGDCGICFEYAVHDAMRRQDPHVVERVEHALGMCNIPGGELGSILFGAEKAGSQQLIETAKEALTDDSLLMYGQRGRPARLKRQIDLMAQAFRSKRRTDILPNSISGLWKADLFLGHTDTDKWVGTSVKINASNLEPVKGLRVGIVPVKAGKSDMPFKDDQKNLVVCPLLHDGSFMEVFYSGWRIVQQFIDAKAKMPREVALPRPPEREVARALFDRRGFPVVDVIDALRPLAQPHLLGTQAYDAELVLTRGTEVETQAVLAPVGKKD